MKNAVNIHHLSKKFGDQVVLNNVSLELPEGHIYGLVGRNGSGKSVLLKCIAGLIRPTGGTIEVFGKQIGKDIDFAPSTGIAIDQPGLLLRKSAKENMRALSALLHKPDDAQISMLLQKVGLQPDERKPVAQYSTGMKQRLSIAMAMLDAPKLLLLDEPMSNMDVSGASEMRRLFRNLSNEGTTLIIATHIAEDVEQLCNVVYRIREGEIIQDGNKMMG